MLLAQFGSIAVTFACAHKVLSGDWSHTSHNSRIDKNQTKLYGLFGAFEAEISFKQPKKPTECVPVKYGDTVSLVGGKSVYLPAAGRVG